MLLDLLLPRRCVVCRFPGDELCARCDAVLPRLHAPLCDRCGAPTAWPVRRCVECNGRRLPFASARAAVAYDDAVRAVVHAWKERGLRGLAAAAARIVDETLDSPDAPLTYVGADPRRARGHAPAAALARELGRRWDVPVVRLLARSHRPPQRGLPSDTRRRNVAGAFAAARSPPRIVLVDDVYTTGATVAAAASALRRAGAREVAVVTFARATRGYTVRSKG